MKTRSCLVMLALVMSATVSQAGVATARCEMRSINAYGEPVSGVAATLLLWIPNPYPSYYPGPWYPVSGASGLTDGSGYVLLSASVSGQAQFATCETNAAGSGYVPYTSEASAATDTDNITMSGRVVTVPRPVDNLAAGNATAELYRSGAYDKPVVVAEPFASSQTPRTASDLWMLYNGDPRILAGGMLSRLFAAGYDVWLVRPRSVGDDINLQAADYDRAVLRASAYGGYGGKVAVAGYSMAGLVVRTAMARWNAFGMAGAPPVNLIAALDSPLRGALVSNDLQHAFWNANGDNGKSAHENNMDSCSALQMLENGCKKLVGCSDCLECNDRAWYEMFYGGGSFTYCNPSQGMGWCLPGSPEVKTCTGAGLLNLPDGGWPAGIRKIGASLGNFGERTGVCYGDATELDKTGTGADGCPAMNVGTFGLGTEWGYLDIRLSTDRNFRYTAFNASASSSRYHWIDELTPGSRQPGSVEDVAKSVIGFKILNGHQSLHMGTFIPLYSALDINPSTGVSSFDEYWTSSYSAFHDALRENPHGTWVNQRNGTSGTNSLVSWLIDNLNRASFVPGEIGSSGCGEAVCVPSQGMYVSHFSAPGCGGTESYYLPYDGYAYTCRTWDGDPSAQCDTIRRSVTNYSARINGGECVDYWPGGNPLTDFVTVYRAGSSGGGCGESTCVPSQGMYVSHFSALNCGGTESYYLPYDGYGYSCRSWDGSPSAQCGTIRRTVTNYSARINGGSCVNYWPDGNTLTDFVTIYR